MEKIRFFKIHLFTFYGTGVCWIWHFWKARGLIFHFSAIQTTLRTLLSWQRLVNLTGDVSPASRLRVNQQRKQHFFYGFNANVHQIAMYSSHLTTFWAKVTKMLVKTSFVLDLMQHGKIVWFSTHFDWLRRKDIRL